jgi:hypothetical protein
VVCVLHGGFTHVEQTPSEDGAGRRQCQKRGRVATGPVGRHSSFRSQRAPAQQRRTPPRPLIPPPLRPELRQVRLALDVPIPLQR